jgi:hypothetical protein
MPSQVVLTSSSAALAGFEDPSSHYARAVVDDGIQFGVGGMSIPISQTLILKAIRAS